MTPDDLRLLGLASTSVRVARGWMVEVGDEDVHVDISRIPSDFIACAEGVPKLLAALAKRDEEIERLRSGAADASMLVRLLVWLGSSYRIREAVAHLREFPDRCNDAEEEAVMHALRDTGVLP